MFSRFTAVALGIAVACAYIGIETGSTDSCVGVTPYSSAPIPCSPTPLSAWYVAAIVAGCAALLSLFVGRSQAVPAIDLLSPFTGAAAATGAVTFFWFDIETLWSNHWHWPPLCGEMAMGAGQTCTMGPWTSERSIFAAAVVLLFCSTLLQQRLLLVLSALAAVLGLGFILSREEAPTLTALSIVTLLTVALVIIRASQRPRRMSV